MEAWSGGLLDKCMQNGLQVTEEANDGGKCPYNPGESGREDPEDAKQRVLICQAPPVYPQLFLYNQRQCVQGFLSYTSALIYKSIEATPVRVNLLLCKFL